MRFAMVTTAALVAATCAAQARSRTGDGVPYLDVKSSCSDAQRFSTGASDKDVAFKGCMQDEMNAKTELGRHWRDFKAKDKADCVEQSRNPSPSYVEVLTCLEMNSNTMRSVPRPQAPPTGGVTAPGLTPSPVQTGAPVPRT